MRSFVKVPSVVLVLSMFGCTTSVPAIDAGAVGDSGAGVDAGQDAAVVDASTIDVGIDVGVDAAAACSATNCTGAHACVRGVCVATCGGDLSGFGAALATGLVVEGTVCHTPAALSYAGGQMYELTNATTGRVTTFTLSRWTPGTAMPTLTTIGTAQYTAAASSTMVFTGGYVAVAPDQMHVLFGYTTNLAGYVGGVFDLATGSGTATQVPAASNYDADFTDATHYVVNAAPSTGQGVYRASTSDTALTKVVSHVGDASGDVALWSAGGVVLAGGNAFATPWPDGMMGDRVLVLDPAMLASATTPIDGATVQHLVMPSSFELISGDRAASVHYDSSFAVDAIDARALTHTGSTVMVGAPMHLATGTLFTGVTSAGASIVLTFANGLLFVH